MRMEVQGIAVCRTLSWTAHPIRNGRIYLQLSRACHPIHENHNASLTVQNSPSVLPNQNAEPRRSPRLQGGASNRVSAHFYLISESYTTEITRKYYKLGQ